LGPRWPWMEVHMEGVMMEILNGISKQCWARIWEEMDCRLEHLSSLMEATYLIQIWIDWRSWSVRCTLGSHSWLMRWIQGKAMINSTLETSEHSMPLRRQKISHFEWSSMGGFHGWTYPKRGSRVHWKDKSQYKMATFSIEIF
jgi:hypothetical protein